MKPRKGENKRHFNRHIRKHRIWEMKDTHDGTDTELHGEQFPTPAALTVSRSSVLPPPPKKQRLLRLIAKQSELLQKACSCLDKPKEPKENIHTIAKAWGEKLNTLSTLELQQRALVENAISDILLEVSLGTLHRYSVKNQRGSSADEEEEDSYCDDDDVGVGGGGGEEAAMYPEQNILSAGLMPPTLWLTRDITHLSEENTYMAPITII
ncbi:uncharacterized protein LOC117282266 [Cryptotermes secundus]|uniref:uncharacterized protein LOC117282266 n=1 Tax=Cryptotermes secundus TaxID=105785 RepID=UPI001454C3F5|nr:uncharacterized protein LOC117282266 [Cryptotermes secundus]